MLEGLEPEALRQAVSAAIWAAFVVADYERIVEIGERYDDGNARNSAAIFAAALGRWDRATRLMETIEEEKYAEQAERAIAICKLVETPQTPLAKLAQPGYFAMLFASMGEPERAWAASEQVEDSGQQLMTRVNLVIALQSFGYTGAAQSYWAKLQEALPAPDEADARLRGLIARCAGRLGKLDVAKAYLPEDESDLALRVQSLAAVGMIDEAYALFQTEPKTFNAARLTGEVVYNEAYDAIDRLVADDTPTNRFFVLTMLVDDVVKLKVLQSR